MGVCTLQSMLNRWKNIPEGSPEIWYLWRFLLWKAGNFPTTPSKGTGWARGVLLKNLHCKSVRDCTSCSSGHLKIGHTMQDLAQTEVEEKSILVWQHPLLQQILHTQRDDVWRTTKKSNQALGRMLHWTIARFSPAKTDCVYHWINLLYLNLMDPNW